MLYANRETTNPNIFAAPTTITDQYDSSIVGTQHGNPVLGPRGIEFDGNDDYLEVTPFEFGGDFTIELYVKPTALVSYGYIFQMADYDPVNLPNFTHEETITPGNSKVISLSPSFVISDSTDWAFEVEHESTTGSHLVMLGYNGSTRFYFGAAHGLSLIHI